MILESSCLFVLCMYLKNIHCKKNMLLLQFLFWFLVIIFVAFVLFQCVFNACLLPWQSRLRYQQREKAFISKQRDEWYNNPPSTNGNRYDGDERLQNTPDNITLNF
jgi:hypothetical protein